MTSEGLASAILGRPGQLSGRGRMGPLSPGLQDGWVPSLLGYRMDGDSVGEAHPHERWPDESQLTSTSDSSHLICPQPPRRN